MQTSIQSTPLFACHEALNAKWTTFSGWQVPLQYQRSTLEHQWVREAVGLFDISHMGCYYLPESSAHALDKAVPIDVLGLPLGKARYGFSLDAGTGGIVDDWLLYRLPAQSNPNPKSISTLADGFVMVVNAGNRAAMANWLTQHVGGGCFSVLDYGVIALQGPNFAKVLAPTADLIPRYAVCQQVWLEGIAPLLAARTGYTGEDGLEFLVPAALLPEVWAYLLQRVTALGGGPCGFAARDSLRLEAALPLYGHELTLHTTPAEAGLTWAMAVGKNGYVGQSASKTPPNESSPTPPSHLIHLSLEKPPIPRQGNVLFYQGEAIGHITSGGMPPTVGVPIAMAYSTLSLQPGQCVEIEIRNTLVTATVVKRPFYNRRDNQLQKRVL
jgi:aminomethyltransferase